MPRLPPGVSAYDSTDPPSYFNLPRNMDYPDSGQATPDEGEDFVPRPLQYRFSGFSAASLIQRPGIHASRGEDADAGTATPRNLVGIDNLIHTSAAHLAGLGGQNISSGLAEQVKARRPLYARGASSGNLLDKLNLDRLSALRRERREMEARITEHVQETYLRHRYLLKLCHALMQYGAPTHRLEEYMKMSARVLEIQAQFLYIPNCMMLSFDDGVSRTTEMKLVRVAQGVDLGKLRDVHGVYKRVVHDLIGVEQATDELQEIMAREAKFGPWTLVLFHGLASAMVGPFAFQARLVDLPIAFLLGCLLGVLRIVVAPKSDLYTNVFEIIAVILTSFLARLFGSLRHTSIFCFSGLAQCGIALILPGYTVCKC